MCALTPSARAASASFTRPLKSIASRLRSARQPMQERSPGARRARFDGLSPSRISLSSSSPSESNDAPRLALRGLRTPSRSTGKRPGLLPPSDCENARPRVRIIPLRSLSSAPPRSGCALESARPGSRMGDAGKPGPSMPGRGVTPSALRPLGHAPTRRGPHGLAVPFASSAHARCSESSSGIDSPVRASNGSPPLRRCVPTRSPPPLRMPPPRRMRA